MEQQPPKSSPVVFDYLDARLYLQDYYQFRKNLDRKFSYEKWSQEVHFKSKSFLRMIVAGKKKITPKLAEAVASNNFITSEEKDYFFNLVRYSQSASIKDRHVFGQRMLNLARAKDSSTIVNSHRDFVSNPLLPRMLSLFNYEDIRITVTNIMRILEIPHEVATKGLQELERLGLASRNKEAEVEVWHTETSGFKVPDKLDDFNLLKFHELSLLDAIDSMAKPKEVRRFKSLLLPMNEIELTEFNSMLDQFASEQINRLKTKNCEGKRVFQANFNIYPVTSKISL